MEIFIAILYKLIPLYVMIYLGYISAKKLQTQKETIATLLIYIIAPIIVFYGTYTIEINFINLSLPLFFFILCCSISTLFWALGRHLFGNDSTKNLLAFTAGDGNTGYFGLPVALILLGNEAFGLAVLSLSGFILYESSVGFFIMAKGNFSAKDSLIKVAKLPTIYAFFAGLLCNYFDIAIGEIILSNMESLKGAYSFLGMILIGMGLAAAKFHHIDYKFISLAFLAKFIVWPIIILTIIFLDKNWLNIYTQEIYNILMLMSVVPLAANTVALATELKVHPEKAAVAVVGSTLFCLLYIPIMASFFIVI